MASNSVKPVLEWKFGRNGNVAIEVSPEMHKLALWAEGANYQGTLWAEHVGSQWNQPANQYAGISGPQGMQGCSGEQGPQGAQGHGSGDARECREQDRPKPISVDVLKLVFIFETNVNYTTTNNEEWIPRVYDIHQPQRFIGSVVSKPVFQEPRNMDGKQLPMYVGVIQPKSEMWRKWESISDDVSMDHMAFFRDGRGRFIDCMVEENVQPTNSLPVLSIKTEEHAFSGVYNTRIEVLATELTNNRNLAGILKAILWNACRPSPGTALE